MKNVHVRQIENNIVLASTFCSQIRSLMWIANSALATRLQLSELSLCESSNPKQIKVVWYIYSNANAVSRIPSDGWTNCCVSFCPQTWTGSVGMWPLRACTPSARQRWSSCCSVSPTRRPSPKTSSPTLCSSTRRPSPVRIAPPGGPPLSCVTDVPASLFLPQRQRIPLILYSVNRVSVHWSSAMSVFSHKNCFKHQHPL